MATAAKPLNLAQLQAELVAAGVNVQGLTSAGGDPTTAATKEVYGVDAAGVRFDLPPAATTVIANHAARFPTVYDTPANDLEAARTALANARTALQTSVPNLNSLDTTIQALAANSSASVILSNMKLLSARTRAVVGDQMNADQAIVDALAAMRDAVAALKARG